MGSAADEPRVLCVVRDMTNLVNQTKFTLNLPFTTQIAAFLKDIAVRLGYEEDSFIVSYERPTPSGVGAGELEEVVMNEYVGRQLKDVCLHCGDRKRNNFNVLDKDGIPPIKTEVVFIALFLTSFSYPKCLVLANIHSSFILGE